ncbi:LLM class flavin-dependent oxidoreductase [Streptomyces anulatus]|uniref:LLM class flavin-dependent oxidoreductase n=1 Tax=Streptomyces anulatus TaxID=1892 RepID=UPI00224FC2B5|nr:LLM class flavin-dependent oxidoreductase [Streptomyces anulatus]MCX4521938.1 LLM class flavin-dependent oxidoreductase [Streptomyces anulatus]MCX4604814.1 LLM class flavin-dependent oxidoreductase [Streptomyces anulatus]WTE29638.1 LLM class flavin-dependent oxidoreductase [Streptomyces anulatus]
MSFQRPFEFGVVAEADCTAEEWLEVVRRCDALGYDVLLVSDHVHHRLAPFPALAAAAVVSDRLRFGTYVLNNDLRNPALVVQEFRTVHELSSGRVLLGVGAGWYRGDYASTGIRRESGAVRLERLERVVVEYGQALPGTPLLLGGSRPRTLSLAARAADVVSILPGLGPDGPRGRQDLLPEATDRRVALVRDAASAAGREPVLNHLVWECFVSPRPGPIVEALARAAGCELGELDDVPCFLVGTREQLVERLLAHRERWGFSFVTVPASAMEAFAAVAEALRGR